MIRMTGCAGLFKVKALLEPDEEDITGCEGLLVVNAMLEPAGDDCKLFGIGSVRGMIFVIETEFSTDLGTFGDVPAPLTGFLLLCTTLNFDAC